MQVCICSQREKRCPLGADALSDYPNGKRLFTWSLAIAHMMGCRLVCGQHSCFVTLVDVLRKGPGF